jgi:hypothetical protein
LTSPGFLEKRNGKHDAQRPRFAAPHAQRSEQKTSVNNPLLGAMSVIRSGFRMCATNCDPPESRCTNQTRRDAEDTFNNGSKVELGAWDWRCGNEPSGRTEEDSSHKEHPQGQGTGTSQPPKQRYCHSKHKQIGVKSPD